MSVTIIETFPTATLVRCEACKREWTVEKSELSPRCEACYVPPPVKAPVAKAKLSVQDVILAAMKRLAESGKYTPTKEDIVVAAWMLAPGKLSLPGYPQYPNSNRVNCELPKMLKRKLIQWVDKSRYRLYQRNTRGDGPLPPQSGFERSRLRKLAKRAEKAGKTVKLTGRDSCQVAKCDGPEF